VDTENQLADIFTKPLLGDRFNFIKEKLKIIKNPKQNRNNKNDLRTFLKLLIFWRIEIPFNSQTKIL
jgi:hypothetical protein